MIITKLITKNHIIQKTSPSIHINSLLDHNLQRNLQKTISSPKTSKHLILKNPIPKKQKLYFHTTPKPTPNPLLPLKNNITFQQTLTSLTYFLTYKTNTTSKNNNNI